MEAGNKDPQEIEFCRDESQKVHATKMEEWARHFETDNISLCPACKMSVCWHGMDVCITCESGLSKPLPNKFAARLRDELKQHEGRLMLQLGERIKVLRQGEVNMTSGCNMADMCKVLTMYCFKNGWAAWGLNAALRELCQPEATMHAASVYTPNHPIEDDFGPVAYWCSCGTRQDESSEQAQLLLSEVTVGVLRAQTSDMVDCKQPWASIASEEVRSAFELGIWIGATPQIMADAMWLAGPGRHQIAMKSGTAQEKPKGARGALETTWMHHLYMNNHVNTLLVGLEVTLLGACLTAIDHGGRSGEETLARFAGDFARFGNIGRYAVASLELQCRYPGILDWHAGCVVTLGLMRGLELRGWAYQCRWNFFMHYDLGSETACDQLSPRWMCIVSALGHDAGDLCSDTQKGCADNSIFAVAAYCGYEGVAACLDLLCDALEAVVMKDTRGIIELGLAAGTACATFERNGGKLCACGKDECDGMILLSQMGRSRQITPKDSAELASMRDAIRSRCESLPPPLEDIELSLDHRDRERIFAETLRVMGAKNDAEQAHRRLQSAYASVARSACGELRRKAAHFRQCVTSSGRSGQSVLDLSTGCICGGVCSTW